MKRQTRYVGSRQGMVLALAIGLGVAGAVRAATWTSGKFGNWSDTSANGWNGAYPNAVGADAYYNSNASAATTQNVAGVVIGTLWMGTAPNGKTWTIATNSAGNGITFSVSTGNGRIQANNGQTFTLQSPLTFNCPMVVTNYSAASASIMTLGGSVTSSQSIVIAPVSSSTRDTSVQFNHLDASGPVTVAPQKLSTGKPIVRILGGTLSGPVTAASGASVQKNVAGYAEPLIVSGDNSATFNGTWVIGGSANSSYGYMLFASANAAGAGRTLAPANAGIVAAGYAIDQAFIDRITTDSNHGVIAMGDGTTSSSDLDYTALRHTEVHSHLAAVGTATFTGSLTPNSGVATEGYVLGGGGGTLILPSANTLTGARTVQVGNAYILPARQGVVAINNTNNFSGACTIRSGGVLSTTHLANGG